MQAYLDPQEPGAAEPTLIEDLFALHKLADPIAMRSHVDEFWAHDRCCRLRYTVAASSCSRARSPYRTHRSHPGFSSGVFLGLCSGGPALPVQGVVPLRALTTADHAQVGGHGGATPFFSAGVASF
jgi:hypothetical protein